MRSNKKMKINIFFFLIPLVLTLNNNMYSKEYSNVKLPTTIVRDIKSNIIKDMVYDLYIDLPPSYNTSDQRYPVVYLLDAYETFGLMLQTYQQLLVMNEVPGLIIVGISYKILEKLGEGGNPAFAGPALFLRPQKKRKDLDDWKDNITL
jgi:hypothetical protein